MLKEDKDLEPISDLKIVQRYLKYGIELKENVSCYIKKDDLHFESIILSGNPSKLSLELEVVEENFNAMTPENRAALSLEGNTVRLSYSVSQATCFVHGKIQHCKNRQISIQADLPMFKLQRRESLRMKVQNSHKASVTLGKKSFSLFDISAGGLSVVAEQEEEKDFQKLQQFPGSTLFFMGKEIKVDLEIKNILKHSKDGVKIRIGFRFRSLSASVEQLIAKEAYLQAHQIWSRWV